MKNNIFLQKLIEKQNLTLEESQSLMEEILQGNCAQVQVAAILVALRMKGEIVEEIVGFIQTMRKHMVTMETDDLVIDTCGTGGDGSGTFNISTASAFVVAGAGVKVAKHGNRAASSQCGSADVLEALGINIQLSPKQAEKLLEKTNFTFLFAPRYHPSMKHVAPIRKELGIRTIFNFLGPFVSPARVNRQIIGVPNKKIARKLAHVATFLDYEHLMIVTSDDGLDEISLSGKTHVYEVKRKAIKKKTILPEDFGFKRVSQTSFKGGNAKQNATIIRKILEGIKGPHRDVVILNSAAALYVSGKAKDIKEGVLLAKESIDSGKAKNVLEKSIKISYEI